VPFVLPAEGAAPPQVMVANGPPAAATAGFGGGYGQPPPQNSGMRYGGSSAQPGQMLGQFGNQAGVLNQQPIGNGAASGMHAGYGGGAAPAGSGYGGQRASGSYNTGVPGAVVRDEAPARIIPIRALNPYQGRWTIKARCSQKGNVRT